MGFANVREQGSWQSVPGMYRNVNAGDPTKFIYVRSDQAGGDRRRLAHRNVRLTRRSRIAPSLQRVLGRADHVGARRGETGDGVPRGHDEWIIGGARFGRIVRPGGNTSAEISNYAGRGHAYQRVTQAAWTSPFTRRLLFDAGMGC